MAKGFVGALLVAALGLGLASCGNGGSAVETRDRETVQPAQPIGLMAEPSAVATEATISEAPAFAPKATGIITGNRRETADAKAIRLFERNGRDFGAATAEDYLAKATAFTSKPPRDAEKVSRPNGDVLIYQASSNTFAVVDRRGVVRTMFKPSTGAAYWQDQKAKAPDFGR